VASTATFSDQDATTFSVIERLTIPRAFTFDAHFEQYGIKRFA
jgi:predicted nucleic acid-binding protein